MKGLIRDILTFLRELQENNDREWFAGQKPRYQKLKEGFDELVDRLIAQTAVWDEEVKNLKAKDCVYRIYRDIRFSPDKRPYKDHFAAYICGYCPEPALLKRIRQDIYENIEEFTSIIREPEFIAEFPELDTDDKLKKVPAPFPADFPEADLLKHKHYDVMSVKPEAWFESDDLLQKVDAVFRKMYKFNRFFNYTIDNQ